MAFALKKQTNKQTKKHNNNKKRCTRHSKMRKKCIAAVLRKNFEPAYLPSGEQRGKTDVFAGYFLF